MKRPFERIKALLIILALICFSFSHPALAGSERHSLTFINKSGKDALVKLVGPSRKVVKVSNQEKEKVWISSGTYCVYVRYGNNPPYQYVRGETFEISAPLGSYVDAYLTLHGVINGNYVVGSCSEEEFNRQ